MTFTRIDTWRRDQQLPLVDTRAQTCCTNDIAHKFRGSPFEIPADVIAADRARPTPAKPIDEEKKLGHERLLTLILQRSIIEFFGSIALTVAALTRLHSHSCRRSNSGVSTLRPRRSWEAEQPALQAEDDLQRFKRPREIIAELLRSVEISTQVHRALRLPL